MGFWTGVDSIIREADIVLVILDARMPELSRNERLEGLIDWYKKSTIFVFNKIDLVSKKTLNELREKNKDAFFVSGTKNIGLTRLKTALLIEAKRRNLKRPKVGIVGYPNVGKSAIINCLAHRARAKTAPVAGTTRGPQFVKAGGLKIIDSPGVVPYADSEVKLGVIAAKNPEKLRNPDRVAYEIIRTIIEKNVNALKDFYGIEFKSEDEIYDIIQMIGKRKGFLKRGGIVDENKTVLSIVRDWQRGKLRL